MTWILGPPWKSSSGKDGKISSDDQRIKQTAFTQKLFESALIWVYRIENIMWSSCFFSVFLDAAAAINKLLGLYRL